MAQSMHDVSDPRNASILINVNGELKPRAEAVVSVFDSGFMLGDGVWEGFRVHKGRIAFLDRHLDRLFEGAKALAMDVGLSRDELRGMYRAAWRKFKQQQTGKDCFGIEGVKMTITGGDGQVFETTTNESGNFFVEGKATDLVKPFKAKLTYTDPATGRVTENEMSTPPSYGGCGRCHNPEAKRYTADEEKGESKDLDVSPAGAWIGVRGLNEDFFATPMAQQ